MSQTPVNEKRRNYRFYAGDPYVEKILLIKIIMIDLGRFIQLINDCTPMEISKE